MTLRIAINGFGRIGRSALRALYEGDYRKRMQVVAINEPGDARTMAHLLQYDSTHGRFSGSLSLAGETLTVNGDAIALTHHERLDDLHWQDVDIVLECSGGYTAQADAEKHLAQGARRVMFSNPADPDIAAIVYGVNDELLSAAQTVISTASCTSNCIIPVIQVLDKALGIECGVLTTLHSMMNDQPVIDAYHHTDLRKTRSASESMIPVDTALAAGIGRVLPALAGKFEAQALRVPTTNVSAMDLTVVVKRDTTRNEVNAVLQRASETAPLKNILGFTTEPLASCDFNHDPRSGIVDASQTRVSGQRLVKVLAWFDNEWAYANRMLDVASRWKR
ncbi:MAG TPA: glyceraldehyde 3-phosphate dehydrogenase NAD-binding domain-containing protein [Pseudomonadales bacterium]|jgi:glyceraldehyde 3-phosphate dehydrogenase/D-erythrose 4-phosphate dehydrogenase